MINEKEEVLATFRIETLVMFDRVAQHYEKESAEARRFVREMEEKITGIIEAEKNLHVIP
jgi:hypothetical protein